MRPKDVREAIALLRLGLLGREATEQLHRELDRSNEAVEALREEQRLVDDLHALSARPPIEVDVRDRVLREVAPLAPGADAEVPRRQLWWAAAASVAATFLLGAAFWRLLPETTVLARDTGSALASVAGVVGSVTADFLPTLIDRLGAPVEVLHELPLGGAPYLPLILVGSAIGYAAMLSTLTALLVRDGRVLARVRRHRR